MTEFMDNVYCTMKLSTNVQILSKSQEKLPPQCICSLAQVRVLVFVYHHSTLTTELPTTDTEIISNLQLNLLSHQRYRNHC